MSTIRIGTRRSALARAQTRLVAEALHNADPSLQVALVPLTTEGDRRKGSLSAVGGKGLFTRRLEEALDGGEVDMAVHSAKDLPARIDERYVLAAFPPRADARDVLISGDGLSPQELQDGARIGTGSPRRAALLKTLQPSVDVRDIRGNVDTRLARVLGEDADLDGVILAAAGLQRLGLMEMLAENRHFLDPQRFIPAAAQGALAVQVRADREDIAAIAQRIDDALTRQAVEAERAFLRAVGADCRSCVAVHAERAGSGWTCRAMLGIGVSSDVIFSCEQSSTAMDAACRAAKTVSERDDWIDSKD
jgi:hydroxymethylbilane synthase